MNSAARDLLALTDNELFRLQLEVAQRADELARFRPRDRQSDWQCWLEAERDVLVGRNLLECVATG